MDNFILYSIPKDKVGNPATWTDPIYQGINSGWFFYETNEQGVGTAYLGPVWLEEMPTEIGSETLYKEALIHYFLNSHTIRTVVLADHCLITPSRYITTRMAASFGIVGGSESLDSDATHVSVFEWKNDGNHVLLHEFSYKI